MSSFREDNAAFEAWLRTQCSVVEEDLDHKHERTKKDVLTFLRATFFRWARRIEAICSDLKDAPVVLSVGDTHLENFGTWRDVEGRLVWGVNDFDEAALIPYPFDIVRLAVSVRLAPLMATTQSKAGEAILRGYRRGLCRPRPTLLDEQETWMRPLVACSDQKRLRFWAETDGYPPVTSPPAAAADGLQRSLPAHASIQGFATRRKGGGSLGRPRFVAIADWCGGRVVREAKALVPSAWDWAHTAAPPRSRFLDLATGVFRSPDPYLNVHDGFVIRRISADSRKVELTDIEATSGCEEKLLEAMGFDLGSIHAVDKSQAIAVREDLVGRAAGWLDKSATDAATAVEEDYALWVS
jgi:hypothetical protein